MGKDDFRDWARKKCLLRGKDAESDVTALMVEFKRKLGYVLRLYDDCLDYGFRNAHFKERAEVTTSFTMEEMMKLEEEILQIENRVIRRKKYIEKLQRAIADESDMNKKEDLIRNKESREIKDKEDMALLNAKEIELYYGTGQGEKHEFVALSQNERDFFDFLYDMLMSQDENSFKNISLVKADLWEEIMPQEKEKLLKFVNTLIQNDNWMIRSMELLYFKLYYPQLYRMKRDLYNIDGYIEQLFSLDIETTVFAKEAKDIKKISDSLRKHLPAEMAEWNEIKEEDKRLRAKLSPWSKTKILDELDREFRNTIDTLLVERLEGKSQV